MKKLGKYTCGAASFAGGMLLLVHTLTSEELMMAKNILPGFFRAILSVPLVGIGIYLFISAGDE